MEHPNLKLGWDIRVSCYLCDFYGDVMLIFLGFMKDLWMIQWPMNTTLGGAPVRERVQLVSMLVL